MAKRKSLAPPEGENPSNEVEKIEVAPVPESEPAVESVEPAHHEHLKNHPKFSKFQRGEN